MLHVYFSVINLPFPHLIYDDLSVQNDSQICQFVLGWKCVEKLSTDLVCIWYIHGLSALGNVTRYPSAPCNAHFLLLFHFLDGAAWANIEQLRHEASAIVTNETLVRCNFINAQYLQQCVEGGGDRGGGGFYKSQLV